MPDADVTCTANFTPVVTGNPPIIAAVDVWDAESATGADITFISNPAGNNMTYTIADGLGQYATGTVASGQKIHTNPAGYGCDSNGYCWYDITITATDTKTGGNATSTLHGSIDVGLARKTY
jgi:hypothetical protein